MPTDLSCPTLLTPSSLTWDKIQNHSGGTANPLRSGRKLAQPMLTSLWPVFFLLQLNPARALVVGPYADNSKLSDTMDNILPGLG